MELLHDIMEEIIDSRKFQSQTDQDGDGKASEKACQKPGGNSRGTKDFVICS